jgi:hypothetical protein
MNTEHNFFNINDTSHYEYSIIKKIKTSQDYDEFLLIKKEGRFVRLGPWLGLSKACLHRCTDSDCGREWKPAPSKCLAEDYYCPSCVLHYHNNLTRFETPRLKWTADVPNTFYLYSLRDPESRELMVKFGRTQHSQPDKRFRKEKKKYCMKLVFSLRKKLITTIKIENLWKDVTKTLQIKSSFSDKSFHGLTEVIKFDADIIHNLINHSITISNEY